MQQEDPKTEILEALRMTDKQKKGYIKASELRTKLTMLGEKLTNKEGKINGTSWKSRGANCQSRLEELVKFFCWYWAVAGILNQSEVN